jgi:rubrerythrin
MLTPESNRRRSLDGSDDQLGRCPSCGRPVEADHAAERCPKCGTIIADLLAVRRFLR